jgi:GntR family transcriptional regulator
MPLKAFTVPKYAQIVQAIQARIEDGTYPLGALIPSETALVVEFDASRPIVVRALGILEQDGWIEAQHGKGRFVRRTAGRDSHTAGAGRGVLGGESARRMQLLSVGVVLAPPRAAAALNLDADATVVARKHVLTSEIGPLELRTVYAAEDIAAGTGLAESKPLKDGVVGELARHGITCERATDRIGARLPTAAEAKVLQITRRDPILTVLVTGYDRDGVARFAVDALLVASRRELEDRFSLS